MFSENQSTIYNFMYQPYLQNLDVPSFVEFIALYSFELEPSIPSVTLYSLMVMVFPSLLFSTRFCLVRS